MRNQLLEIDGISEVRENIFFIENTGIHSSNSILILDDKNILIDTGSNLNMLKKISNRIDIVINSHYHLDHIRGNGLFEEVRISKMETPALEDPENYLRMCGVSDREIKNHLTKELSELESGKEIWMTKVDPFSINDVLNLGKTQWKIIHTPGHSPGHCCFYEEKLDILISGDYGPEEFGPWYGWPSCDLTYLVGSIRKIIDLEPGLLLSGHVKPIEENILPMMRDYLDIVRDRDKRISDLDELGKSMDEIMEEDIFYSSNDKSDPVIEFFERTMISKHLEAEIF